MSSAVVEITHVQEFSAAHRLTSPHLSDDENRALYGPCFNAHGHNYVLEVTVRGEVDARTGMVMDLNRLSQLVVRELIERVDHKHLNHDVPFLAGVIPTAENVAIAFWRELEPRLPTSPACRLHRIRLRESNRNLVDFYGPTATR